MIEVRSVCKSFGGLTAVRDCSLSVEEGSITGLIGPNGAGKSTLFNMIAGLLIPDSGSISLDGKDISRLAPHERFRLGIARTFQIAHEFGRMTVLENLTCVPPRQVGESIVNTWLRRGAIREEERRIRERAEEVLSFLRLDHLTHELAGSLSGGQKKLLELGRTMMTEARIVLLDELGAGVNRTLLSELAGDIERLNRERGYTFFVIEHDMDLISRLCDPVIVMAEGTVLTRGSMTDIKNDARVIEAYLGRGAVGEAAS